MQCSIVYCHLFKRFVLCLVLLCILFIVMELKSVGGLLVEELNMKFDPQIDCLLLILPIVE